MSPSPKHPGRKLTAAELRERAVAVWETGSYGAAGARVGISRNGISATAGRLGFARSLNGSGEILRGPCVRCLAPHDIGALDSERACPRCVRSSLPDEAMAHGMTLAEERAESRRRERERMQGKREGLGQKRTPVSRVLKNARVG